MRYLSLLGLQLRKSVTLAMQYRWDFVVSGALALLWTAAGLVPFHVAFHDRPPVGGWTYENALVVVGFFTLLRGVLDGAVNPSLLSVVQQIREGTLDFVLLKPADAQFLVSTTKFEVFRMFDAIAGLSLVTFAFVRLGRAPTPGGVLTALAMLAAATVVLYSIWILVIAAAFWVVRVDNLAYLFDSLFDFARWPVSVFQGVWKIVFTFIIPLGVMTTYPAEALLGSLATQTAVASICGAAMLAVIARFVWTRAIGHYTSASS
ncbi:ABC transporter permease [Polyangium jinanense]|uniref:ABC-2 family transporter protein n=1 Tax=Polyangium jinanense TaxID=2829994 RepID=A0A9X3X1S7_9BACT|nr:ABC-2 family transporter protein [Polyangium jinanense]MDC3954995.1 ABC-2 family transporter protein [Polyangium jinanense]MDC3981235.1 ABC-2 family transporter protein [Polyangium jinanense]